MSIMECCEEGVTQKLSFEETKRNSTYLNFFFHKHISARSYIGMYMTHNIHVPALILSMKSCGHIFMPLNKNFRDHEIRELVEEANIQFLLLLNESEKSFIDFQEIGHIFLGHDKVILLKRQFQGKPFPNEDTLLCILTTTGTTGKRKLIKIESYCIEKNVKSLSKLFNLTEEDVIFYGTPLTFDPSLVELFLALQSKATLMIVPESIKLNPERLFQTLFHIDKESPNVTFLQMVPSLFRRWTEKQIKFILKHSRLKMLVLGGEPFPAEILKFERSIKLFNIYGITEVSCWATLHELKDDNEILIGNPLEETILKICLDGEEIQEGIGELFIGSDTRFCYVDNEVEKVTWRPTGDIVKKIGDSLIYLSRKDYRVKRLGHQVNLNEIELKIFRAIELASKCIWHHKNKLLLFILIPSFEFSHKSKILDKLRVKLLHLLPAEEFPDFIDVLHRFPVNQNGKLDLDTLVQIYEQSIDEFREKQPSQVFLMIISNYLGHSLQNLERMGKLTFKELGGNSILHLLVTNELKDILKCDLPLDFILLLFRESLEKCLKFLDSFDEWPKYQISHENHAEEVLTHTKRIKSSLDVEVDWKFNLYGCVDATPIIFEKGKKTFVAVGSFSNFFVILDAITGEKKFSHQFPDSIGSEGSVSPCLKFLYFGCFDGNLYCIDLEEFKIAWNYQTRNQIKCKPNFCLNNEAVVFGSYDKYVHCINTQSGVLIWKTLIEESVITQAKIHEKKSKIVVTTTSGSCFLICEKDGMILYHMKLGSPIFSTPYLLENILISCDVLGNIFLTDVLSGSKIYESYVEGEIYSSIKYVDNHFIFGSTKGELYKYQMICEEMKCSLVDKINLGNSISSTPDIFHIDGKMIIVVTTSDGHLYLINFKTFQVICYWKGPAEIYSSIAFCQDRLYIGCRDNNLYCLKVLVFR